MKSFIYTASIGNLCTRFRHFSMRRSVFEEAQACVRSTVASLPTHERLVMVLFYGYRYSYNEVSALLKIPLTTVKKRLYSARQKLKVQLQAALHDTSEHARRSSDGSEGAEICLARWWSWSIRCVKAIHDSWQTRSCFG
jgi:Sigma-70, region 4